MSRQYLRNYELFVVGEFGETRIITELRIRFSINKYSGGRLNTAMIEVFNANLATLSLLETKYTRVLLRVGYGSKLSQIFLGQIRNVFQIKKGVDSIAQIFAADGEVAVNTSFFNTTYEADVPMNQIIMDVINSFNGVVPGIIKGLPESADKLLGQSISGSSKQVMDTFAEEYNFDWSIQDGQLVVLPRDQVLAENEVIVISGDTGMIGSPTVTNLGADVSVLLVPEATPGALFQIISVGASVEFGAPFNTSAPRTRANGFYKVREVQFIGDSWEGEWLSNIKGNFYGG